MADANEKLPHEIALSNLTDRVLRDESAPDSIKTAFLEDIAAGEFDTLPRFNAAINSLLPTNENRKA